MKLSKLLGARFKESPADCQIASHIFMTRGGYMKNVGNGIFSLYTPAKRIMQKIEAIVRDEMDKLDGQEVQLPVAMPASLWQESGRFDSIGSELLRFKDRGDGDMVLGMTHEEAAVHLARDAAPSYAFYPFMIYQFQTKFRDEQRARGGLIRLREFMMKDAYSFHLNQEDLEAYYEKCLDAYERIFKRAGIDVISIKSDSGMMGGNVAHEFMLLTDVGEDTIILCDACDFRSNMEVAECIVEAPAAQDEPLILIETPNTTTIDQLCTFFSIQPQNTCKAVIYRKNATGKQVIVFIRGDLEVNETKLRNFIGEDVHPDTTQAANVAYGYAGPVNFTADATLVYDRSLQGLCGLVTGANKSGYHYTGFNPTRDIPNATYHDFAKTYQGAICPQCKVAAIKISNGIEVGNIFQLGTKYTASMNMQYADAQGELHHPIMGCYGVGISRLAASVCEAKHDDYGPIWPISIAPWQVHICAIRSDAPEVSEAASALYADLTAQGVEVLFDDRVVSAGVMFSDADLLGVPIRATVSPKTCGRGVVELSLRDKSYKEDVPMDGAAVAIKELVARKLAKLEA
ncbi:MAG: proline--tRNA ligase [Defluviitaleaceae bacterium]|nr:proline--tRNA ligase [Defluviitaleaceae bacterium]